MREDFPAPFGPSRPNIPVGMVKVTSDKACTPLEYCLFRFLMINSMIKRLVLNQKTV
jgi:hypothetical protein